MKVTFSRVALILLALSVRSHDAVFARQEQQGSSNAAGNQTGLVEVPQPDLATVEANVQEHIRAAQKALADTLANSVSTPVERGEAYGTLGQVYQAYGFDDAARASYENAAKLNPGSFRWSYYAGY